MKQLVFILILITCVVTYVTVRRVEVTAQRYADKMHILHAHGD